MSARRRRRLSTGRAREDVMHSVRQLPRAAAATATAAALLLALSVAGDAFAQQRKFSFGYDQPHTTGYGIAADIFNDKLKELSGGKFGIDQFPGASLGQEPVMLQKLRSGDIDFIITSSANASTVAPESGVMSLHFLFRDEGHLRKSIADPGVVTAIKNMIAASVQGAHVLCVETLGFRYVYSKNEYHKVEDLKGVKIRVQATKTEDTHFPAYGAQTVHMPFGEVYTSLQTGVVQAAENGVNVYLSNKHYEVAPIMSMTEHEANNGFNWVSDKTWSGLSEEEKRWVQAAADEVARVQPDKALQLEKESAVKLEKLGIKFVRDVDKSGFQAAAKPIQDSLAAELGPHAVKIMGLIRAVQ
jgi:tripartite ATP-independent transporter DctP family solute receptor